MSGKPAVTNCESSFYTTLSITHPFTCQSGSVLWLNSRGKDVGWKWHTIEIDVSYADDIVIEDFFFAFCIINWLQIAPSFVARYAGCFSALPQITPIVVIVAVVFCPILIPDRHTVQKVKNYLQSDINA